ncbi:MAG: substrate binding domain-containing protein, partial [Pseudomonadota bacterium]
SMVEARLLDNKASPSGTLRITTPNFFGSTWLVPQLSKLHEKYPELQLSLLFDDKILNLNMREADVAIRLYKPDQQDLIYTSLGKINFHVFGSKDYFAKHGKPKSVKDLKDHLLLGYPENVPTPYEDPNWLFRKAEVNMTNNPKLIKINSLFGIYEAVHHHAGLAVLPDYLVAKDKSIEICLESTMKASVEMYFVYAEERKHSNRIKILQEFLVDSIKKSQF